MDNESKGPAYTAHRRFLHRGWPEWPEDLFTDQQKGLPHPPLEKPYPSDATLVDLVAPADLAVGQMPLIEAIGRRRSHRKFTQEPLTLQELSFLLWAIQGVQEVVREGAATLRTVPSAGARHPLETYLLVNRVEGVPPALYRYLPLEHKLCFLYADEELPKRVNKGCLGQNFVGRAAVVFVWTVIPYRTEWRYAGASYKVIAMDAGHACQNLYLACENIGCGTCAVAAYDQEAMDRLLGVDGEEEFTVYLAPVGKKTGDPEE